MLSVYVRWAYEEGAFYGPGPYVGQAITAGPDPTGIGGRSGFTNGRLGLVV